MLRQVIKTMNANTKRAYKDALTLPYSTKSTLQCVLATHRQHAHPLQAMNALAYVVVLAAAMACASAQVRRDDKVRIHARFKLLPRSSFPHIEFLSVF